MNAWIGIDPGARWTGVVATTGGKVATWSVVDRDDDPTDYLRRVEHAAELAYSDLERAGLIPEVAIEGLNPPSPHMGMASVAELLGTAEAIGYLRCAFRGAYLIPPNKHGSRPWCTYPDELLTKTERRNATARPNAPAGQSSTMRHARSAWDVAQAAPAIARLNHARRTA